MATCCAGMWGRIAPLVVARYSAKAISPHLPQPKAFFGGAWHSWDLAKEASCFYGAPVLVP